MKRYEDILEWREARDTKLKIAEAAYKDPQLKIGKVNKIVKKFEKLRHLDWGASINDQLPAQIRVRAKHEMKRRAQNQKGE